MRPAKLCLDITLTLGLDQVDYPGDQPYRRDLTHSFATGDEYVVASLAMSSHSGTHVEAPAHFLPAGPGLDAYPLNRFILPAMVATQDRTEEGHCFSDIIDRIAPGMAVLFKAGPRPEQGLSLDTAKGLVRAGVGLVGWAGPSVDDESSDYAIHKLLLSADMLILEGLTLAQAPCGLYMLVCLPLKMLGAEASPVRAALLR